MLTKLKRIILCTVGWTIMDTCLGIALYLAQELKLVIEEDPAAHKILKATNHSHNHENAVEEELKLVWHELIRLKLQYFRKSFGYGALGETVGYLASFAICLFFEEESFAVRFYTELRASTDSTT